MFRSRSITSPLIMGERYQGPRASPAHMYAVSSIIRSPSPPSARQLCQLMWCSSSRRSIGGQCGFLLPSQPFASHVTGPLAPHPNQEIWRLLGGCMLRWRSVHFMSLFRHAGLGWLTQHKNAVDLLLEASLEDAWLDLVAVGVAKDLRLRAALIVATAAVRHVRLIWRRTDG